MFTSLMLVYKLVVAAYVLMLMYCLFDRNGMSLKANSNS